MNSEDAKQLIVTLRDRIGWYDPQHIATASISPAAMRYLSKDPCHSGANNPKNLAAIELHLETTIPNIDRLGGIHNADDKGIYWNDGDLYGGTSTRAIASLRENNTISDEEAEAMLDQVEAGAWREYFLPWRYVKTYVLHTSS